MLNLSEHFVNLVDSYGLSLLFPTIFFETFGLPLPGESALVAVSALAANGSISILAVFAVACLAAVAGDNVAFLVGRRYGRPIILTYGRRVGITETKYETVEQLAKRYGSYMVVFARFFVLLRQMNGLVAGSVGMPWAKFLAANVLGSVLWVLFWTTLAYHFGKDLSLLPEVLKHVSILVALLVPVLVCFAIAFGRSALQRRSQMQKTQNDGS